MLCAHTGNASVRGLAPLLPEAIEASHEARQLRRRVELLRLERGGRADAQRIVRRGKREDAPPARGRCLHKVLERAAGRKVHAPRLERAHVLEARTLEQKGRRDKLLQAAARHWADGVPITSPALAASVIVEGIEHPRAHRDRVAAEPAVRQQPLVAAWAGQAQGALAHVAVLVARPRAAAATARRRRGAETDRQEGDGTHRCREKTRAVNIAVNARHSVRV